MLFKNMKKSIFISSLIIVSILIAFFIFNNKNRELNYSFYHWKNSYNQTNIKDKLYIKVLEVKYSNKIELIKTRFITNPNKNFVPVVYITNEAMKNLSFKDISKSIVQTLKNINIKYQEVQIDCDWSDLTKVNYFKLLEDLKSKLPLKLSATIRLHQIKYYKRTGVPPVDYGLLMYYNMSTITKLETKNSILDNTIAKKYHYNFETYPLKLKLALPLYSQAIWFRKTQALEILEGVNEKDFSTNFEMIKPNIYKCLKSDYFKGRYIYKNDIFRFEDSKEEDIKTALKDFFSISSNNFDEIIFYTIKYKNKYDLDKLIKDYK